MRPRIEDDSEEISASSSNLRVPTEATTASIDAQLAAHRAIRRQNPAEELRMLRLQVRPLEQDLFAAPAAAAVAPVTRHVVMGRYIVGLDEAAYLRFVQAHATMRDESASASSSTAPVAVAVGTGTARRENVTDGRTGIVGCILRNLPFRSPRPANSVAPEENLCTICMLAMNEAGEIMALSCNINHKFHRDCIRRWLSEHETCPICRALVGRML